MNADQITHAIMTTKLTNDELNQIVGAVKFARSRITEQAKFQLRIGDKVKWKSSKASAPGQGTITKIAIKYATVSTVSGNWKVPVNMLEKI
jgi:hypothetical protein